MSITHRLRRTAVVLQWIVTAILLGGLPAALDAQVEVVHVDWGANWRFKAGLAEASTPVDAWRAVEFDEIGWSLLPAPIGYGDEGLATDLDARQPSMRGVYSSFYLRHTFTVADPAEVGELIARLDFDDGVVVWLNGTEVVRNGVEGVPGEDPPFDAVATRSRNSGNPSDFLIENAPSLLMSGDNVLAVQVVNRTVSNSDVYFDLQLVDPSGPDRQPPEVDAVFPAEGRTVRRLGEITVTFNEPVEGVDAADLLANGVAANSVTGSGNGPYRFLWAVAPSGAVTVRWADDHGIVDVALAPNTFAGGSWTYRVDPDAPLPQLVISEFLASNVTGITDEDRQREDWIEVTNNGDAAVDLEGIALTDDVEAPGQWVFPSRTLASGERIVVFASGKDRRPESGNLHTSFKLNAEGDYLALFSSDSPREVLWEYAPRYPIQRRDIAYGVGSDGSAGYFDPPTAGEDNGVAVQFDGVVNRVRASAPRGLYEEGFQLELNTATPQSNIYYTLDGQEPTPETGTLYDAPLEIDGTPDRAAVTIRAAAYADGKLPSEATTFTYLFPSFVRSQPDRPDGFPTRWGTHPSVDYGIDPEVVNDPAYREDFEVGLRALPTVSLVSDVQHFFGARGIYSNPTGEGVLWERPTSAELMPADGSRGFQVNCGVRIQGGASRQTDKSGKHSFRLLFKGAYGPTKLRYPFFPDSPIDVYDTIIFRADFNNSWIHWSGAQRRRGQKIRDQWARDTQRDMGQETSHGIYVNLYVNGLYWGVYNAVERPSASFGAQHFGGDKDEYDALNSAVAVDGTLAAWSELMRRGSAGAATPQQFLAIEEYLDLEAFADYMIVNFYGSNADWPHHNWYAVRRRQDGEPYRFICWDTERIIEDLNANRTGVADANSPGILWQRLRLSPEFQVVFGDRVQRHFFEDGALTPEKATERFETRAAQLEKAIVCESARWGDYRRDVHAWREGPYEFYRRATHWLPEQNRILTQYFPRRGEVVLRQFRGLRVFPSQAAPVLSQHGGTIEPGLELSMTLPEATQGEIVYTLDGSDPRTRFSGEASPTALTYTAPIVLNDHTVVRARSFFEGDWSALTEATFRVGDAVGALRIAEIHYHPNLGSEYEFVEIVNTAPFTVGLSGCRFTNGIRYTFGPRTQLRPNERLVLASNAIGFGLEYPDATLHDVFEGSLSNGGEKLTLKTADGTTIDSVEYDDEGFWPLGPDSLGHSLVLVDANLEADDPASWASSEAPGGSPGAEDPVPAASSVIVNEVLPRPGNRELAAVELYNDSNVAVDVSYWYLSDARDDESALRKFLIPPGTTIEAQGFLSFDASQFGDAMHLAPAGGGVFLAASTASGELTGYVVGGEYPPALRGVTYGRVDTSNGPEFVALEAVTLGGENALPRVDDVVINEVHYQPVSAGEEFVELHNTATTALPLFDTNSGRGWRLGGLLDATAIDSYEFPAETTIPAGGFVVVTTAAPDAFRALHAVPPDVPVLGPAQGALDNSGERLRLLRPLLIDETVHYTPTDHVRYNDRAPWSVEAAGGGPSLERRFSERFGNEPLHWGASLELGGTPGRINSIAESEPVGAGQQLPGDCTQDGSVNLTDALCLLNHLFFGGSRLPCEGNGVVDGANRVLLNSNGDARLDLADGLHLLNYLFLEGPPPELGVECVEIEGCAMICR